MCTLSLLDLVTEDDDDPDELEFLNRSSVNGFMRSPYMTDLAAVCIGGTVDVPDPKLRDFSEILSRCALLPARRRGWILKGDCHTKFWEPFLQLNCYNVEKEILGFVCF